MKKRTVPLLFAISCFGLFWLAGCGPSRLAGGTETQNPEIVACVKKMAAAAFDAADAENSWQPTSYLQAQSQSLTKRLATAAPDSSSSKYSAGRPDTAIIGDSVSIIRDTVFVVVTQIRPVTIFIDSTIFINDTVIDTVRSGSGDDNRFSIVVRAVRDSIRVKDTVVLADTIVQQYKRMIVSVQSYAKGLAGTTVQADTNWIYLGVITPTAGTDASISGWMDSAIPSMKVVDIAYQLEPPAISFSIVNSLTKDTTIFVPGPNAVQVRSNQMFISSATFDNNVLVETIRFDAIDSLLSIIRFNPSAFDTVESLTINYSIDLGADKYSGTDDKLLGIERSYSYRLGTIYHLDMAVSPHPANSSESSNKIYSGMITMKLAMANNAPGIFNGTIDKAIGFYGVFELNGKKYQVNCDSLYTTHIVEMTD